MLLEQSLIFLFAGTRCQTEVYFVCSFSCSVIVPIASESISETNFQKSSRNSPEGNETIPVNLGWAKRNIPNVDELQFPAFLTIGYAGKSWWELGVQQ